jgi:putative ABC transport system permease protein
MNRSLLAASIAVGFDTLRGNPLRTLLSTLGVIMGVAALVSVLSLGDGMERFARTQIASTTDFQTVSVSPQMFRRVDGQTFPRTDIVRFTAADADALGAVLGSTARISMSQNGSALVTSRSDTTPHAAEVMGALTGMLDANGLSMAEGRFFTAEEVAASAPVVVLSQRLAADFAHGQPMRDLIGDTLLFHGAPRVVIGVLAARPEEARRGAVMPLGAAASAMAPAMVGRPTTMQVRANRIEDVDSVRAATERWLATAYGGAWKERVNVATDERRVEQLQQGMLLFKLFMGALTGISLLVGGIGIMNVLLASVIERTREIGIRKATGARQRHIFVQFLAESVAITGVGSVLGILLGLGGAYGATAIMRSMSRASIHAGVSASTIIIAITASVAVGVIFGLYPALRAARLSPIDAIHHE